MEYKDLVWLSYRLAATFSFGLPLVLLVWASIKKESSIVRLLSIYWKIASIIAISILLLTSNQSVGYLTLFAAPFLMIGSIWFWLDLNEELSEMSFKKSLALATKIWRWTISFLGIIYIILTSMTLSCFNFASHPNCQSWVEGPQHLHGISKVILNFLFGGNWSQSLTGFIGYITLIVYIIGLLQWVLIRFPKQGRIAGNF
tara:strand:- start:2371 stop:2973 length:603 start_codon:yes stop_codon:yes gene_type:complete